jgi:hypothetical protein
MAGALGGWHLDRKVRWLIALEDAVDVSCCSGILVGEISAIRHQAACIREGPKEVDRWDAVASSQRNDQVTIYRIDMNRSGIAIRPPLRLSASAEITPSISSLALTGAVLAWIAKSTRRDRPRRRTSEHCGELASFQLTRLHPLPLRWECATA